MVKIGVHLRKLSPNYNRGTAFGTTRYALNVALIKFSLSLPLPTRGYRRVMFTVVLIETTRVFTARCTLVQSAVLQLHDVRPSVRPSVSLVDHDRIGWQPWKLIARTISPAPSILVAQRPSTYSQGNVGKFWGN